MMGQKNLYFAATVMEMISPLVSLQTYTFANREIAGRIGADILTKGLQNTSKTHISLNLCAFALKTQAEAVYFIGDLSPLEANRR